MVRSSTLRNDSSSSPDVLHQDQQQSGRQRIFEAAEMMFAAHGYKATPVQAIVDHARINKRMLYHYFGSKRGLYDTVVQHNFSEILGRVVDVGSIALQENGPVTALAVAVREYFDALLTHPRYVGFMLWEEADRWSVLNRLPRQALDRVREFLTVIVDKGAQAGIFDPNLNRDTAWSYIIGVPSYHFSYRPRLQLYLQGNLDDPVVVQEFRREVVRFALLGLGTPRDVADRAVSAACQ